MRHPVSSIVRRCRVRRSPVIIETIEPRMLLSASATGTASVGESQLYTLTLPTPPANSGITSYSVDWGNGAAPSVVPADGGPIQYVWPDGPSRTKITVNAITTGGVSTPVAVRLASGGASAVLDPDFANPTPAGPNFTGRVAVLGSKTLNVLTTTTDGKIITAGFAAPTVAAPSNPGLAITRFLSTGQPDFTFGMNAQGRVTIPIPNGTAYNAYIAGVRTVAGGKIVVAGTQLLNNDQRVWFVARLNADGSPDATFSGDGFAQVQPGTSVFYNLLNDMTVTPDGKVVVAGYAHFNNRSTMTVAQFDTNGDLDNGFGTQGYAVIDLGVIASADTVARDDNGNIVIAGLAGNTTSTYAVARLTSTGQLDSSFGTSGIVYSAATATMSSVRDVAIDADNRVLLGMTDWVNGAASSRNWVLMRFTKSGAPDSTFNGVGLKTINFGGDDLFEQFLIQPDGKILALGYSNTSQPGGAMVRLNSDGTPDATFAPNGQTATPGPALWNLAPSDAVLLPDGSILATEGVGGNYTFVTKYLPESFLTIDNLAPTATVMAGPTVTLGTASTVSFSNPSDPSSADRSAGFKYSFDFNYDGDFVDPGDVLLTASGSATFNYSVAGTYKIGARITDKDGGFTDYSAAVTVNPPTPSSQIITLQAETAALSGGTTKSSASAGYNGTGYADYAGNNSAVQWTATGVAATAASVGKLEFRYANGSTGNRPLTIFVNNVNVGTLPFAPTGAWNKWATVSLNTALPAGTVTIRAVAGTTGGANVDQLVLTVGNTTTPPNPTTVVYQAEDARRSGAALSKASAGYTGSGYVDYGGNGSYVEFTVNRATAGAVSFALRYANGNTSARPLTLYVNGTAVGTFTLGATGGWNKWSTVTLAGSLLAGNNVLRLVAGTAGGPNVDSLSVISA